MKKCPNCQSIYTDDSLQFCLQDGGSLINYAEKSSEAPTRNLDEMETVVRHNRITDGWEQNRETQAITFPPQTKKLKLPLAVMLTVFVMCILFGGIFGIWFLLSNNTSKGQDSVKGDNTGITNNPVPPIKTPLITSNKGQDLSGIWINEKDGIEYELHQLGNQVNFEYRGSAAAGHGGLTGKVSGNFDGKTLRGAIENHEGNVTGRGTVIFTLNGDRLEGICQSDDGKQSDEWILVRKSTGKGQDKTTDKVSLGGEKFKACNYLVGSGIYSKWIELGGEQGKLGCPTMNETAAPSSPQGTTGRMTQFTKGDGGYLIWHESGRFSGTTFDVSGCMFILYSNLGGTSSWLGFPVSDGYQAAPGARQDFESGFVTWDSKTYQCKAVKYRL